MKEICTEIASGNARQRASDRYHRLREQMLLAKQDLNIEILLLFISQNSNSMPQSLVESVIALNEQADVTSWRCAAGALHDEVRALIGDRLVAIGATGNEITQNLPILFYLHGDHSTDQEETKGMRTYCLYINIFDDRNAQTSRQVARYAATSKLIAKNYFKREFKDLLEKHAWFVM